MKWTKIGEEYTQSGDQKSMILDAISKAEWLKLPCEVGFMPGYALRRAITDLKLNATHVFSSPDLSPYGLLGIRTPRQDVILIDDGTECTVICHTV